MNFPLFFDISGGELIVILLFVLLFFGSKGIPDIARTLGRTMRQVRDASNEVQREIHKGTQDIRQTMEEQRRMFNEETPKRSVPPVIAAVDPVTAAPEPEGASPDDPRRMFQHAPSPVPPSTSAE